MTQMLDCLVSYFGLDENQRAGYRRYFCYQIVAGPGPAAGSGVAVITTLAVSEGEQRCDSCQSVHLAELGGPAVALAAAVRYLDRFHENDHLLKVLSGVRSGWGEHAMDAGSRLGRRTRAM